MKKSALAMGMTLTASSITAILEGCSSAESKLDWQPKALSDDEARVIGAIAEVILPKTDTPGALELKVDRFVDIMMDVTYSREDIQQFSNELGEFSRKCKTDYGAGFEDCLQDQQVQVLKGLESSSEKFVPTIWGGNTREQEPLNFYRKLKSLIMLGYYSSEET